MTKRLLIIGNGVSRLYQRGFISNWEGEIWGCNQIYKELDDMPRLDRITGDLHGLPGVFEFIEKNNLSTEVWVKEVYSEHFPDKEFKIFTTPAYFQGDSGTSLVAQALHEGYGKIYVVGFDLGGPDIHIKDHEKRNKAGWVSRWRAIGTEWGLDRIHFVGKNHKPFLLSTLPADTYAKVYMEGQNHLKATLPEYKPIQRKKTVLILGNGTSRLQHKKQISEWKGEIWGCNHAYKEAKDLPRLDRVGSVHNEVAQQANIFKKRFMFNYLIYVKDLKNVESFAYRFTNAKGWSTGSLMLCQALIEKYEKIVLAGFDFGGPDIYQKKPLYGGNFTRQFEMIKAKYDMSNVYFISDIGLQSVLSEKEKEEVQQKESRIAEIDTVESEYKLDRPKEYNFLEGCNNLLILGNGASILDYEFGDLIDHDFDVVVRINDYVTRGYEKHIGTKTSYWVSGAGNQTRVIDRNIQNIQPLIMLPIGIHDQGVEKIIERIRKNIGEYMLPYSYIVPRSDIEKICELSENFFPTTGLMTIMYFKFLKSIPNVYIHGFDFFEPCRHYYDNEGEFRTGVLHNIDGEKEFIKELLSEEKITELKDLYENSVSITD